MGYFSHHVELDEVEPGDHIYTWRTAFVYSHHGIYVGENMVIHFTAPETPNSGSGWNLTSMSSTSNSGSSSSTSNSRSGIVSICSLQEFIKDESLCRYVYGLNRFEYYFKPRWGTATMARSDPPQVVVARANYLLQHGFGKYDLVKNNCEDFSLYCKTSLLVRTGGSGQVWRNMSLDIGVRGDAIKVKVEDVWMYK